ncbi:hypothetical protein HBF26_08220 [Luteibacter jiangsuensis]|uniref:Methyltransferase family protein n=2 Tax=Luteibacter jiangsuensis TaxID=637577 RepID=A0ABX0Q2W8_9GAMM|nr:hypothetical protein [Luteibacter jiangsuensis]
MNTQEWSNLLANALTALEAGKDGEARDLLAMASERGSHMAAGLLHTLAGSEVSNAYDQPRAFERFIRGDGNRALYDAVSAELASIYATHRPHSLLDIGAGDGMALAPAVRASDDAINRLDVVEPNTTLLASLMANLPMVEGHETTLEQFVSDLPATAHWDMAQSTFALQSIAPDARKTALRLLAAHVDRLVIVEFDVPDLVAGTPEYRASLAARYEQAASDCGEDAELVAGGFLAPMLLGQLRAAEPSNHEQSKTAWIIELADAGFRVVRVTHVHAYSWANAFLIEAVPVGHSLDQPTN